MSNFVMLALCLLAGLLLRVSGRVPDHAHLPINAVVLHLSLPALTLTHLRQVSFDSAHLVPVLMPWLLFAVGAGVFWLGGRLLRLPASTVGALTLVGGFGNTSFVGLPMIESLHGRDGMALGLLIDQLGSYLALSTVGLVVATAYAAGGRVPAAAMLRKVIGFPPFVALVLAFVLMPVALPAPLEGALARVADTLAPLALLSVGLQLRFDAMRQHLRALGLGLGFKLLACPALVVGLLCLLGANLEMPQRVSVIEAAMPPMIGAGVVAAQARLDAPLVSLMIGLGIPLGLVTAPMWHLAFGWLAQGRLA